jgi:hypothetical protein
MLTERRHLLLSTYCVLNADAVEVSVSRELSGGSIVMCRSSSNETETVSLGSGAATMRCDVMQVLLRLLRGIWRRSTESRQGRSKPWSMPLFRAVHREKEDALFLCFGCSSLLVSKTW